MLRRTRSRQQLWSWLLIGLLFSSSWGVLLVGAPQGAARCATTRHACCCVQTGLASCACDGHAGVAAQLASLTTCTGTDELPILLVSPPAAPAPARALAPALCIVSTGEAPAVTLPPSITYSPPLPPPRPV